MDHSLAHGPEVTAATLWCGECDCATCSSTVHQTVALGLVTLSPALHQWRSSVEQYLRLRRDDRQ